MSKFHDECTTLSKRCTPSHQQDPLSLASEPDSKTTRRLAVGLQASALRKLDMLNAAHVLGDLRSPPGNRLEALKGELKGRHSIRVNDQWRIVFRWAEAGAAEVELRDYHR